MNTHIDQEEPISILPKEIKFGETLRVISVHEFQKFCLPEGLCIQMGNLLIYDSFILPEGGIVTIIGVTEEKWLAMAIAGQLFLTSFEIIPETKISWCEKALNYLKSFK